MRADTRKAVALTTAPIMLTAPSYSPTGSLSMDLTVTLGTLLLGLLSPDLTDQQQAVLLESVESLICLRLELGLVRGARRV